ncbi:MAG: isoaspartyl peptidase/L-asparaginase [Rhodothermales bacterium]
MLRVTIHSYQLPIPTDYNGPILLIHGGAWAIPDDALDEHRDGLRQALSRGRALLLEGAPAVDVACETVATMEAHGAFDAGCGAVLTDQGTVELDAGLMDGSTHTFGAVAGLKRFQHPIRVADTVRTEGQGKVRLMMGEGAEAFAEHRGHQPVDPALLIHPREQARFEALREAAKYHTSDSFRAPRGTVGCVVRDGQGHLAAATSTGGTPYRPAGRVGDSPLPGGGFYATPYAAASATGWGEAIATVLLCGRAVWEAESAPQVDDLVHTRLHHMAEMVQSPSGEQATGGLLLITQAGEATWGFSTPRMARGFWFEGHKAELYVEP